MPQKDIKDPIPAAAMVTQYTAPLPAATCGCSSNCFYLLCWPSHWACSLEVISSNEPIDSRSSKVRETNRGKEASSASVHSNVAKGRHGWL